MNHYFLIASLPLLAPEGKPPLTLEAFLEACRANLPESGYTTLLDLLETDGAAGAHPFARDWRDRETELRNAVVRHRARLLRVSPDPFLRPQDGARVFIQAGVAEAFQAPDPLAREKALDRLRWRILDDLAGLNPFGLEAVFSYGLKLRLAWRGAALDPQAGAAALERAVAGAAEESTASTSTQKAETV